MALGQGQAIQKPRKVVVTREGTGIACAVTTWCYEAANLKLVLPVHSG